MALRKIESVSDSPENILHFNRITQNSIGEGLCYVRYGQHKYTRYDKPFIVLYLQDIDNIVIPGYIWEVDNFIRAGLDITEVTHSVVKIKYRENYIPHRGLTLTLDGVYSLGSEVSKYLPMFVGTVKEVADKFARLTECVSAELDLKVTIPYSMCTSSYMDYEQGSIGGLVIHYWDMFNILKVYADHFTSEERKHLWGTFLLYVYVHSNYMEMASKGKDDIHLLSALTSSVETYVTKLNVTEGAMEVLHIFFGYTPKDMFVRLICQVSKSVMQAHKEYNMYQTLPISREGDAGYGTIRKYNEGNQGK